MSVSGKSEICPYCGSKITHPQYEKAKKKIADEQRAKFAAEIPRIKQQLEQNGLAKQRKQKKKLEKEAKQLEQKRQRVEAKEMGLNAKLKSAKQETAKAVKWTKQQMGRQYALKFRKDLQDKEAEGIERGRREAEEENMPEQIKLRARILELERITKKNSPDELGAIGEDKLMSSLKACFPTDNIQKIKTGKHGVGADIRHETRSGDRLCGTIIYECKNVSTWSNSFLQKALTYRSQYNTPYIFIVSTVFPPKFQAPGILKGIILTDFKTAPFIARLIRENLIELSKRDYSQGERNLKEEMLFQYIQTDEFRERIVSIQNSLYRLEDLLAKEKSSHSNVWVQREQEYHRIRAEEQAVEYKIKCILEEKQPLVYVLKKRVKPTPS